MPEGQSSIFCFMVRRIEVHIYFQVNKSWKGKEISKL